MAIPTENKKLTQSDERDEEADTCTHRHDERLGHHARQPLTKTQKRENEEDPPGTERDQYRELNP